MCSGYMSPEYAMDGIFSVKSDVFSFGVLVMEIISGKKNRGFYSASKELNLLGHVRRKATFLPVIHYFTNLIVSSLVANDKLICFL